LKNKILRLLCLKICDQSALELNVVFAQKSKMNHIMNKNELKHKNRDIFVEKPEKKG